jgi:hypothetical protein
MISAKVLSPIVFMIEPGERPFNLLRIKIAKWLVFGDFLAAGMD